MRNTRLNYFILAICTALVIHLPALAAPKVDTVELLDLFGDVFEKVKRDYVEEVNDKELIESAINGMLTSLDPHSSYLNEEAFDEMRVQTRGEFGGLGIEVTMDNGLVKVVSPIDDTPAFKAGLKPGDFISRIDDEAVVGFTLSEAVDKMRGKPGTKVKLTILREGNNEPMEFTLTRAVIKIESVRSKVEENVAYIRVTSFSEQTATGVENAVNKIKGNLKNNFQGIVLDLRNNPGGLLDQAIGLSDLFLDKGEIVSTRGRVEDSNKRYNAKKGDVINGKPIVVLVNGGSASASEIVAGALQDHKRAIVMGTRSFGKGSVQTVIPLSASQGAMRLTTSRYYTPAGRSIQAEGIMPDITVEEAKLEVDEVKKRMTEADLRRHLKNTNTKEIEIAEKELKARRELYKTDYQLARAIDLISGINVYDEGKQ